MGQFDRDVADDGTCVVRAGGEVDMDVAGDLLRIAVEGLAEAPAVTIDLRDVTFMDSSGLGVLVRIRKEAAAAGKPLVLLDVPRPVHRLLTITQLTDLFEIVTSDVTEGAVAGSTEA